MVSEHPRTGVGLRDFSGEGPAYQRMLLLSIVLLIAVMGCGVANTDENGENNPDTDLLSRVSEYPTDRKTHVLGEVAYETKPPTGGDHFHFWHNCHFYTKPVINELAVHSLEHGAVWVAYKPDIDETTLAAIREAVSTDAHLLASPYPGLDAPLVLSAWERQMTARVWEDPAVEAFIHRYRGRRSPTAPEAGAACENAVGRPDDPNFNYDKAIKTAEQWERGDAPDLSSPQ